MRKRLTLPVLLIVLILTCGCTLARILLTDELVAARVLSLRAGTTRIAIAESSSSAVLRNIARIRMRPALPGGRPQLYINGSRSTTSLFEVIDQSTIRHIRTGELFELPFRIFQVKKNVFAKLRSGPGNSYKLYKTLPSDRFVLVRKEQAGWYFVQADEIAGWIAAVALLPIASDSNSKKTILVYEEISCTHCQGTGLEDCSSCELSGWENCPSCNGTAHHPCGACKGMKNYTCPLCKGKSSSDCPSCRGYGKLDCRVCKSLGYQDCLLCRGSGKIPCSLCDGKLHTRCYFCFGSKKILRKKKD